MHPGLLSLIFFTLLVLADYSIFASTELTSDDPSNKTLQESGDSSKSPTTTKETDNQESESAETKEETPAAPEFEDNTNKVFKESETILVNSNDQDLQAVLKDAIQQCNNMQTIQIETANTTLDLCEKTVVLLKKLGFSIMQLPNGNRYLIRKNEIGNERSPESMQINFTTEEVKEISKAQRNKE
jgi:hypothetical protein